MPQVSIFLLIACVEISKRFLHVIRSDYAATATLLSFITHKLAALIP